MTAEPAVVPVIHPLGQLFFLAGVKTVSEAGDGLNDPLTVPGQLISVSFEQGLCLCLVENRGGQQGFHLNPA